MIFHCDTKIIIGNKSTRKLSAILKENFPNVRRIMIVTDRGLVQLGMIQPIIERLRESDYFVVVFDDVSQNPRDIECLKGAEMFKENDIDLVLAVGGGSPIDTAKTIALIGPNGGTPLEYFEKKREYQNIKPICCIPTTAGTGSEVTRSAVITIAANHQKITLKHAKLRPALAVLDGELTLTVPPKVTAATGVDALVHAIEGYTCNVSNPISQSLGAEAMRKIIPNLPKVYRDGKNLEARLEMLEGSLLAGMCFGSADVAAVHCLAEALGSLYDTPHGIANAVFLPYVLAFNVEGNIKTHAELAKIMKFAREKEEGEIAAAKLVSGMKEFTKKLGIPNLTEIPGVNRNDINRLAELAYINNSTASNVREITLEDYKMILKEAFLEEERALL
ncbi:iron-containing alcohol dehydrogenase [Niallia nealsonii]|uniref:Alcohol dehydrogenase n=1 Tax=Niallia nealsonii TaxID=115979 RepID=A0A2N0Z765_9BACI|nr:iron-containing alcohol dehydrogenase [Niallia nealsonii]PKG25359.1 alcohol dehydrogenase [Niallia nealsonii]